MHSTFRRPIPSAGDDAGVFNRVRVWPRAASSVHPAVFACIGVLLAMCLHAPARADVTLVKAGEPRADIILAKQPTRSAQLAARELQTHLRLISGATLPIHRTGEAVSDDRLPIFVGESAATRLRGLTSHDFSVQQRLVRVNEKRIILLGRDDPDRGRITYEKNGAWPGFRAGTCFYRLGTLDAVYDALERFCGVRWYMVTDIGRVVPRRETVTWPEVDKRRQHWTVYRRIGRPRWGPPGELGRMDNAGLRRYDDYAPRRAINLYALRTRRASEPYSVNHSVYDYYERFGDSHPEWFVGSNPTQDSQLRYDNPAVVDQVTQDALRYFALPFADRRFGHDMMHASRVAAGDYFPVVPLDNRNYGENVEPPLEPDRRGRGFGAGVASNYIFTWVNKVAKRVRGQYPGAKISTIAYADMFEPPDFNLEPNVAVSVTAVNWSEYFFETLRQWRRRVSRLYTWEYHYPRQRFLAVRPRRVGQYIARLRRLGVDGMFMEMGDQNPVMYHLDYYVTMKMLTDPDADADRIVNTYYEKFYGPASEPMARFWNTLETAYAASEDERNPAKNWVTALENGRHKVLRETLARAAKLAESDPYAARIALVQEGVMSVIDERAAFAREVVAAGLPKMTVPRVDSAPKIDGKLDDPAWEHAATTPAFVTQQNESVKVKTHGKVAYDDDRLYIAFRCAEPNMDQLKVEQNRSSSMLCTDDSIEVNIDMTPGTSDYLQIMVSAKGYQWLWWRGRHAPNETPALGVESATTRGDDGWRCEIAVPFEQIAEAAPSSGERWRVNLMRNRFAFKSRERFDARRWTCWSPPFSSSWHIKDRFGKIRFE